MDNTIKVWTPFQEALKLYMLNRGVTARGLGASLGVDHSAISRFISGQSIHVDNYNKILTWFVSKPNYPPSEGDQVAQIAARKGE